MHITGRTATDGARTGRLVEHRVDHANDAETEGVLRAVIAAKGRLDVLVNNAWPGYERMVEGGRFTWTDRVWEQPMWRWDQLIGVGCGRPAAGPAWPPLTWSSGCRRRSGIDREHPNSVQTDGMRIPSAIAGPNVRVAHKAFFCAVLRA
ncbi:hypothetical protein [Nonomuraea sp. NPDC049480]|uniref:hypothetical protein n=1 Tax=Nonomuraea sp. NPDC049480 TaxID=3364353 RepID=UPI00378B4CA6